MEPFHFWQYFSGKKCFGSRNEKATIEDHHGRYNRGTIRVGNTPVITNLGKS